MNSHLDEHNFQRVLSVAAEPEPIRLQVIVEQPGFFAFSLQFLTRPAAVLAKQILDFGLLLFLMKSLEKFR